MNDVNTYGLIVRENNLVQMELHCSCGTVSTLNADSPFVGCYKCGKLYLNTHRIELSPMPIRGDFEVIPPADYPYKPT